MGVEVIIGYGNEDAHRFAARAWVARWYRSRGYTVTEHRADGERWVKADAFNPPVLASTAEVVVLADSDSFVSAAQLERSIEAAQRGQWSAPFTKVRRLSPAATLAALSCDPAVTEWPPDGGLSQPPHDVLPGGGIVVFPRELAVELGPFDPRFRGWGGEDYALGCAARTLAGEYAYQVAGPLWHLWHPPQPDAGSNPEADALGLRYRVAKFRPEKMRALIEEGRCSQPA